MTQGITGRTGQFHTANCLAYAFGRDCFVAGVTPGRGGEFIEDVPVFETVVEARDQTGCDVSVIYVPPPTRKSDSSFVLRKECRLRT